ncbi:MAG: HdeD family acid-resistance protein [Terriglobales bacterium]
MAIVLATNWWAIALRGVAGIVFGILALLVPGAAIAALVILFGAYALVDGIFAIVAAVRTREQNRRWGTLLLGGILGVVVAGIAFFKPGLTVIALVAVVAVWAILTGILELAAAIRLRKTIQHEWLLGLLGVVSILFGIALSLAPIAGALVLALWIGAYALVTGVVQLVLAFKLRNWLKQLGGGPVAVRAA